MRIRSRARPASSRRPVGSGRGVPGPRTGPAGSPPEHCTATRQGRGHRPLRLGRVDLRLGAVEHLEEGGTHGLAAFPLGHAPDSPQKSPAASLPNGPTPQVPDSGGTENLGAPLPEPWGEPARKPAQQKAPPRVTPGGALTCVDLRGFEPLTPSMRTRCATGLRHRPLQRVKL